jgi:hypothetical protein
MVDVVGAPGSPWWRLCKLSPVAGPEPPPEKNGMKEDMSRGRRTK